MSLSPALALHIRMFTPEDTVAVSGIICRCLQEINSKDYDPKTITHMVDIFSPSNLPNWLAQMDTVIVVIENEKVVGTGCLKENRIMTVFVSPDDHGKGVGSKIMGHLEGLASQRGHKTVVLRSSLSSFQFYQGRDYIERDRIQEEMGGKMIEMEKAI